MNETRVTMLIQQWLQGELSDAEFGELERHLKTDPAARTAVLARKDQNLVVLLHVQLRHVR